MNALNADNIRWSENVVIADADYVDSVAFNLIVNFERMLDRRIPQADFSQWTVNIALDGNLRPGEHTTQIVLLHDKSNAEMTNFRPSNYDSELNKQAFRDEKMGEFIINTIATGTDVANKEEVLLDLLKTLLEHQEVKRIMLIPDLEHSTLFGTLRSTLRDVDEDRHITLFGMQPTEGGNFKQQILGFSLMNAMGITQAEIDNKLK